MDRLRLVQSVYGLLAMSRGSGSNVLESLLLQQTKTSRMMNTQLISLSSMQNQQTASYSAYKKPGDEEDAEDEAKLGRKGHLPRISTSAILHKFSPERVQEALKQGGDTIAQAERRSRIQDLLQATSSSAATSAAAFMEQYFSSGISEASPAAMEAGIASHDTNEDYIADDNNNVTEFSTPEALDKGEEEELLAELKGLRKGSQRIVLQKLLQGGMLRADPSALAEWEELQKAFRPPENFRMKVVDVNRTCKGTRSGGLYRYSCMVVVGNGEGVLGWGQGKAAEVNDAVKKAYMRACRNLYPIPRFNSHTIPERTEAKFGKVKVVMYPKSAGSGIVASTLVTEICKMAGIYDIGVKIHGSRNPRNTVKSLFEAFDKMRTHEEIVEGGESGKLMIAGPPGRFAKMFS